MRISGNELSSVILSQRKYIVVEKVEKMMSQKCRKKLEPKGMDIWAFAYLFARYFGDISKQTKAVNFNETLHN